MLAGFRQVGLLAGLTRRAASSAPSVYDKLVPVTVVDLEGRRHALRGLEGQTIAELLAEHSETLGEDAYALGPGGSDTYDTHVKIPTELFDAYPAPTGDSLRELEQVAAGGSIDEHSRLGSALKLKAGSGSFLVALGGLAPWRTV